MLHKISHTTDMATQATVVLNHENINVRNIGQSEAQNRKYKILKLGGGQAHDQSTV